MAGGARFRERKQKGLVMLKIYPVILQVVKDLGPVVERVQRHDADLAKQMRRAMSSVPLNVAEGMYSAGGNRKLRYHTAMGSMRETLACIEVATSLGYVEVEDHVLASIDHVMGTLYNLSVVRQ
jgi:four helix bundle protein